MSELHNATLLLSNPFVLKMMLFIEEKCEILRWRSLLKPTFIFCFNGTLLTSTGVVNNKINPSTIFKNVLYVPKLSTNLVFKQNLQFIIIQGNFSKKPLCISRLNMLEKKMTFRLLLCWRIDLPKFWKNNVQVANNTYSPGWEGILEIRDINNPLSN